MVAWDRESLAWAAGLLEGEGSFILRRGQRPEVRCAMTDEDVIRRLSEALVLGHVYGPFEKYFKGQRVKDQWHFVINKKADAYAVMVALYPWLGTRRREQIAHAISEWVKYEGSGKRYVRGPQHHRWALSDEQVARVRSHFVNGAWDTRHRVRDLAEEFGVHTNTIYRIAKGQKT